MKTTEIRPLRARDRQPAGMQDIKNQAQRLHRAIGKDLTYNQALELISQSHGYEGWSQLRANLEGPTVRRAEPPAGPIKDGPLHIDPSRLDMFDVMGGFEMERIVEAPGHMVAFTRDGDGEDMTGLCNMVSRTIGTRDLPLCLEAFAEGRKSDAYGLLSHGIMIERSLPDADCKRGYLRGALERIVGRPVSRDFRSAYDAVVSTFEKSHDVEPPVFMTPLFLPWEPYDSRIISVLPEMARLRVFVVLRVRQEILPTEVPDYFPYEDDADFFPIFETENLRNVMNACQFWVAGPDAYFPFLHDPNAPHRDELHHQSSNRLHNKSSLPVAIRAGSVLGAT